MAWKVTEVILVNGEKVPMALESVSRQEQTFIRINEHLVAGVVKDSSIPNIYIWQKVDGIYQNIGDIVFRHQEDGSVSWLVYH